MNRRMFLWLVVSVALAIRASAQWHQVPGSLVQVASGTFQVWGINAAQGVYRFNPNTNLFDQIPGNLVQIAVGGGYFGGPTDDVWGINVSQGVYRFNPNTGRFDQMPGSLVQIAVGEAGIWGINSSGEIYQFDPNTGLFDQVPGSLVRIAVGGTGVWGINSSGEVYRFNRNTGLFDQMPGSLLQIAAGGTDVWGLNASHQIYRFNRNTGRFDQIPGSLLQIAVGGTGVWGINSAQGVYRFNPNTNRFDQMPGSLVQIAAGRGLFGLNASGQIFMLPWPDPIASAQPAKLLVVAPAEFQSALQPLIDHKNQTGMPSLMVTTESLYDAFDGVDASERIKRGIYEAFWRLGISYVLLVGDAQKLPVRYYFEAQPPGASVTPVGGWMDAGYNTSDGYYANLLKNFRFEDWDANGNGKYNESTWTESPYTVNPDSVDGYPWVAVGRIPANNITDIQIYVEKVIRYETGQMAPHYEVTFLADANYPTSPNLTWQVVQNSGISNVSRLNLVGVNYGTNSTPNSQWTNGNFATVDNAVDRSWWISYIGHGYNLGWGIYENGKSYDNGHVSSALTNAYNLPIVFAAACDTGYLAPSPPFGEYLAQDGNKHWFWYYDDKAVADKDTNQTWDFSMPEPPITIPPPAEFDFLSGNQRTLAYSWLFGPYGGGAIAYFGENQVMPDQPGSDLEGFILAAYVNGDRVLGDMWLNGQASYWSKYRQSGDNQASPRIYLGGMALFGDPSLRLQ